MYTSTQQINVSAQQELRSRHFLSFCIAGFTYWYGVDVCQQLKVGDRLGLLPEPYNPYDPSAVAIYYMDKKIGYVPRYLNAELSQLLYFGHDIFEAIISQINFEKHPEQQVRVVIRIKNRP